MALDAEKASQMLDRLEQATVEYERATVARVADARREKAEARQALLEALVGKQGASS
ncbi:hypothetical protein [Reyranella sp.]|jgi:hypothetical protein|uniref:hypothetical protein n=1 Tax=Reyranella sp. TaxID=1929291 RepID=UPI002613AEFA|nr:hypothetical protein [Reyranella sp.]HQS14981.1 hypothetical protein [Reyranella sp.]HQT10790.1 hypothetical protein [Reyranella sp.]